MFSFLIKYGKIPIVYAVENDCVGCVDELLVSCCCAREQVSGWSDGQSGDKLIHLAARNASVPMLLVLTAFGMANVNEQNYNGETALHVCIQTGKKTGKEEFVQKLSQLKASPHFVTFDRGLTPLHLAVCRDDCISTVKFLIEKMGANCLKRTKNGSSCIHLAARFGLKQNVQLLLSHQVPSMMPNKSGMLAIHEAAKQGHVEIVQLLLAQDGNVNVRNGNRETPLHLAVKCQHLATVQVLIAYGADVNAVGGKPGKAPIHIAVETNQIEIAKLLLLSSANVNVVTIDRHFHVLHIAAQYGLAEMAQVVLRFKANVFALTRSGETALHLATRHGHFSIVNLLLSKVAWKNRLRFVNSVNQNGETCLHLASELLLPLPIGGGSSSNGSSYFANVDIFLALLLHDADPFVTTKYTSETALHYCSRSGSLSAVQELFNYMEPHQFTLLSNKVDKFDQSPLMTACRYGHSQLVHFLSHNNARVDFFDENGFSALHIACSSGFGDSCQILLDQKAFVNAKTKAGYTPLHLAASAGFHNLVYMLVKKYQALVDSSSLAKETALHFAAKNGHKTTVRMLIDLGASINAKDDKGQSAIHLAGMYLQYT